MIHELLELLGMLALFVFFAAALAIIAASFLFAESPALDDDDHTDRFTDEREDDEFREVTKTQ